MNFRKEHLYLLRLRLLPREVSKIFVQHLCLILGKISDLHIMPDCQLTVEVNLAHDTFYQGANNNSVLTKINKNKYRIRKTLSNASVIKQRRQYK